MLNEYFAKNAKYLSAEVRNVKTKRATRDNYGDEAIGYVQLKRQQPLCTLKAKITPEHRIHQKGYSLTIIINEDIEEIISCECHDCAASAGGCKHTVAVLLWLHRRSEEPSVTSTTCYWRTSKLSSIGKIEPLKIRDMCQHENAPPLRQKTGDFRKLYEKEFVENTILDAQNADNFLKFMQENMSAEDCRAVQESTVLQSKSDAWCKVRFARITASKIYEASHCKTMDGVLVESILGATEVPMTEAIMRGQKLEKYVLEEVGKQKNIVIRQSGIIINPKYPIFGASPDGLSEEYCFEVKCPSKENTIKKYFNKEREIAKKPYAQIQIQMFLANKKRGLFCVASPSFEQNKVVNVFEVDLDVDYCNRIISEALEFWKLAIYRKLCNK